MSAISIDGELIHYEVLGRGRPVILIHSWVGSWRYWVPTMQNLQLKYRVYALDLHGFGDSGKNPARYSLDNQVKLIGDFMEAMAIPKAGVVGHGLGAWVATQFAYRHPQQVPRLMLISPPLFEIPNLDKRTRPGRHTAPAMNTSINIEATIMNSSMRAALLERLKATQGTVMDDVTIPAGSTPTSTQPRYNPLREVFAGASAEGLLQRCFKRTEPVYGKLETDLPKLDPQALRISSEQYEAGRMLDEVWLLTMPVSIVHGENDPLISVPSETVWDYVTAGKEDRLLPIPLPDVRHFPMLEYDRFNRLVNEFFEAEDISKLEIKERWKRRSR
jgi:pimeloyl-ACP methyl ester carboxylesterase